MAKATYDLAIINGTVVTASDTFKSDIGVRDGIIVAMGELSGRAERTIDAKSRLVLPGGIDSHCHIDQPSSSGARTADDFYSGTVSAAFGGTTMIIPFACQHRGQSVRNVVADYHDKASGKAISDYSFHIIVTDPTEHVIGQELPALIRAGYTSYKIYLTYDRLKIDDRQALEVLAIAKRDHAMVMVHAENHEVIKWITDNLLREGKNAPKYHAVAHQPLAESEATHRAIALSKIVGTKILIVHVSSAEAMDEISRAQRRGFSVFGETCPQYLFLSDENLDREGFEGAKCVCTPPPRGRENQEKIWRGITTGVFQVVSSDHAPFRFDDPKGKLLNGNNVAFNKIPPGIPGLEVRLPLMFSAGVNGGRISLQRFVEISSTNHAKIYGLHPKKGTIAIGSDADIAIWDPDKEVTISQDMLHDNMDYTPYAGMSVKGWPVISISRGRVLCDHGKLEAEAGQGEFIKREASVDAPNEAYAESNWRSRLD